MGSLQLYSKVRSSRFDKPAAARYVAARVISQHNAS